jgi:hypothetical protein
LEESTVLVKRVPNSGTPSVKGLVIVVTLPVWISAAAALVTAGVMRLVAPVWSPAPKGETGTTFVQSLWAWAQGAIAAMPRRAKPADHAAVFIAVLPRW